MEREGSSVSLTPERVAELVGRGVGSEDIARLLVATGAWSEAGAEEIVSTLIAPADGSGTAPEELGWPGPPDDAPPLFAA
jgi:hypothetical protein